MNFLKKHISRFDERWIGLILLLSVAFLNCGYSMDELEMNMPWFKGLVVILGFIYAGITFISTAAGLVFMTIAMLFSPELPLGSLGSRSIVIRIEDILIPILMLTWFARSAMQRKLNFVKSPVNIPIFALLLVSFFSTVQGYTGGWVKPLNGFFYYGKMFEYFLIFFLVVNYVQTERQIKIFLFFALFTIVLVGLYTILQVPTAEMFTTHRISAPFEDKPQPATVGGYLVFAFLILLSLFLYEKNFLKRWFLAGMGLCLLISLLYTFSRTAYVALIVGVIVLAVLSRIKWLRFLVVLALLSSPITLPGDVKDRIAWTWIDAQHEGRTMGVDYSFQERIYSFRRAAYALKVNPFWGLGVSSWEYPDNQYARSLHEVGFLGLGLWLWIFFRLYKMARWLHRYLLDGTLKGLALGYGAGVIAILIHAWGSCTFYIIRIMEPFWLMSGLVVALYLLKVNEYMVQHEESVAV